ncbi:MAG: hypothetical protein ACLFO5_06330, partial [Opitutales bacterium]
VEWWSPDQRAGSPRMARRDFASLYGWFGESLYVAIGAFVAERGYPAIFGPTGLVPPAWLPDSAR